ncbi:unnamed protein product [Rhodiola kirilowii]
MLGRPHSASLSRSNIHEYTLSIGKEESDGRLCFLIGNTSVQVQSAQVQLRLPEAYQLLHKTKGEQAFERKHPSFEEKIENVRTEGLNEGDRGELRSVGQTVVIRVQGLLQLKLELSAELLCKEFKALSLSWLSLWRMVDSDLGLGIGGGVGELVVWCGVVLVVGGGWGPWPDEAWMAYWSVRDKESQVTGAEMSAVGVGALLPVSVAPSTANLSANKSQAGGNELNVDFREDEGRAVTSHKWRMVISYDGTRYSGWQYQSHPPTIQCVVEKALTKVTKLDRKELCLVGASRTDKGVHAWGQVAHFLTPFNYAALDDVHAALNGVLPDDIRVRELSPALPEFHARFSVESKIYHYKIYNDAVMDPFQRNYAFHSTYRLNPAAMKVAATHFVGMHDFSAFANVSRNDRVTNPVKRIYRYEVVEMGGALLQLEVEGSGFLYKQVRNMAALLYQIGKESIPPEIVPMILASRNRRELAKYTLDAPPHGLTLISVKYNKEHLQLPVDCSPVSFGRCRTSSYCKLPFY